jgi:outer membrane protein assembly factor BamE (lipoprotein component of BamABCDE complex)
MNLKKCIALVALLVGLSGCSKMTAENYAKLQTGMSFAEVNAILGSPQSCDEALGFKSCQWGDEKSHVTARFVADKLVLLAAKNIH